MFKLYRVLCGAALTFALIGGPIARADDDQAANLMITPKVGRSVRLKSVVKLNFMGQDIIITRTQKTSVKEVKADGDVVEEIADEGGVMSSGKEEEQQPAIAPYTVTGDKFGKRKEFRKPTEGGAMKPEISQIVDIFGVFIVTDKPVMPNDTWQNTVDNPAVPESKITLKGTYLGVEKIDGKPYWKIKQSGEAVINDIGNKMSSEATEWVNPTTGAPFKVEDTITGVPTIAGTLTLQITKSIATGEKPKPAKKAN